VDFGSPDAQGLSPNEIQSSRKRTVGSDRYAMDREGRRRRKDDVLDGERLHVEDCQLPGRSKAHEEGVALHRNRVWAIVVRPRGGGEVEWHGRRGGQVDDLDLVDRGSRSDRSLLVGQEVEAGPAPCVEQSAILQG